MQLLPSVITDRGRAAAPHGFLSYSPHSGHADQMRQLTLARALAELLQRTLVLPSLLSHFDASAATTATNAQEVRFADRLAKLKRPSISWLLNLSALAVPSLELSTLPISPWRLPECASNATAEELASSRSSWQHHGGSKSTFELGCVRHVEPPSMNASVSAFLRRLSQQTANVPLIHFRSLLWVHSERDARRSPLSTWEDQMVATTNCRLQLRQDIVASARVALEAILPPHDKRFIAAHVRALREAHEKGENEAEWTSRILRFVKKHQGDRIGAGEPPIRALFIASDSETMVLPKVKDVLSSHSVNISVYSSSSVGASALRQIHATDDEVARLALDISGVVAVADLFSASPRSGLSVHLLAMRACQRMGAPCEPHSCVAFAHTACGGSFPRGLLRRDAADLPRHDPLSKRCSAMDVSLSAQGLERMTGPRAVRPVKLRCVGRR